MTTPKGALPANIMHFVQALRRAGVPVGPSQTLLAIRAVAAVGFQDKARFKAALRCTMIQRKDHMLIFDQLFHMFWRDPEFLETMITNLLPVLNAPLPADKPKPAAPRAAEALARLTQAINW